mgnify:CR=1 FL=1
MPLIAEARCYRCVQGFLKITIRENDIWVFKTNSNGALNWQTSIGGSNIDYGHGITQLDNGKIVVVGVSSSNDIDIPENKGFEDLIITTLN